MPTRETIQITGMSCGGCVASVRNALQSVGIEDAVVEIGSATVEYDEASISHDAIVEAIEDAGFDVEEAA